MTEVIPGINLLQQPLPNPNILMGYVNIYLIQGDNGCLLIDTGWDSDQAFDSIKGQLAELGTHFEDISQIVVTHIHPDHYSLAGRLKQLSQAKITMHHLERDLVEPYGDMRNVMQQGIDWLQINGIPIDEISQLLNQMRAANPEMMQFASPVLPDTTLDGGEVISVGSFTFKVLWTPGHSPGHICLYEPVKKILISGDHILPTITPIIELHPHSSDNPLDDYINSLNAVKPLDISLVLPGHENPFSSLQLRIEKITQHHKQRNSVILETIGVEPKTAYQIANEIPWIPELGGVGWQDLSPGDRIMAVSETLAHLESMRFGGKVDKSYKDSTIYYQATGYSGIETSTSGLKP
jgi:glyoxylase-like metal-dependent hydrolase (beta-lactamase superfamily II)